MLDDVNAEIRKFIEAHYKHDIRKKELLTQAFVRSFEDVPRRGQANFAISLHNEGRRLGIWPSKWKPAKSKNSWDNWITEKVKTEIRYVKEEKLSQRVNEKIAEMKDAEKV